jgi:hypothetical protein
MPTEHRLSNDPADYGYVRAGQLIPGHVHFSPYPQTPEGWPQIPTKPAELRLSVVYNEKEHALDCYWGFEGGATQASPYRITLTDAHRSVTLRISHDGRIVPS